MPARIKHARERLVLAKLVLRILKTGTTAHLKSDLFGSHSTDALLLFAVLVGHLEGRPMTPAKLAGYSGIPRPTAVRKLREMERRGLVIFADDRTVKCVVDRLNRPEVIAAYSKAVQMIHNASAELSKMDSKAVAPKIRGP